MPSTPPATRPGPEPDPSGLAPEGVREPHAKPAAEPLRLDILLVEDNKDTLFYLALLLGQAGHRVRPAANLAQAIALGEAGPLDLLISDIELPDGTGLDLVRHLHATRPTRLPAIAMSGFGSDDDVRLSLECGFLAHLVKPIDFRRLVATIREALAAGPPPDSTPAAPPL